VEREDELLTDVQYVYYCSNIVTADVAAELLESIFFSHLYRALHLTNKLQHQPLLLFCTEENRLIKNTKNRNKSHMKKDSERRVFTAEATR
jgi:hypothetical protein